LSSLVLDAALFVLPTSPEEFLQVLCDTAGKPGGAVYWSRSAEQGVDPILSSADSIEAFFSDAADLSVFPGTPLRPEIDYESNSYTVSFPEASWSWTDGTGRIHRATGKTVVTFSDGLFHWVQLSPLEGSVSVGSREQMVAGVMMTLLTLMIGVFVLWWVKRRWGVLPKD
jgi:hypothetical protein